MDHKSYWKIFGLLTLSLLFYMFYPFLDGIIYGIFIYYITLPIYRKIHAKLGMENISAAISLLLIVFIILLPALLISTHILNWAYQNIPSLVENIQDIIPERYLNQLSLILEGMTTDDIIGLFREGELHNIILDYIRQFTEFVLEFVFRTLLILFITLVVTFYLLKDGPRLRQWFLEKVLKEDERGLAERYFDAVDSSLHTIFVGVILTMVMTVIFAILSLTVLNSIVPEGMEKFSPVAVLALAVLCGLVNLLPGGVKIVWVPLFLLFFFQACSLGIILESLGFLILFAVVMAVIVDFIPDQILRPWVCGRKSHTGIILFAFIFGVGVFGAKGLFIGPILAVLVMNFMRIVLPEIRS